MDMVFFISRPNCTLMTDNKNKQENLSSNFDLFIYPKSHFSLSDMCSFHLTIMINNSYENQNNYQSLSIVHYYSGNFEKIYHLYCAQFNQISSANHFSHPPSINMSKKILTQAIQRY